MTQNLKYLHKLKYLEKLSKLTTNETQKEGWRK